MDMLLCLKRKEDFIGYDGNGDFDLKSDNESISKLEKNQNPLYAYTGLQIIKQDVIKNIKKKYFSLKEQILRSLERKKLFGYIDENQWFHFGTVEILKGSRKIIVNNFIVYDFETSGRNSRFDKFFKREL